MKNVSFFLDSCNPDDTDLVIDLLGKIDGQTTNPTLLTKNTEVKSYLDTGKKLKLHELLRIYEEVVRAISQKTVGPISVEVYADWTTKSSDMIRQAEKMHSWAPNIYVKFPTIPEGLMSASTFINHGGRVNMTLVFDTYQAAAVYMATINATNKVFVSPFVGRWDDCGYYGLGLIQNIRKIYDDFDKQSGSSDCHVKILSASLRSAEHLLGSIVYGADIVTAPLSVYKSWCDIGRKMPFAVPSKPENLRDLPNPTISYNLDYMKYHIDNSSDGLLNCGLSRFANDWNRLII
jgi:transaldolase